MSAPTLDEVIACPNLPSLPQVAMEVLELTADPNVNMEEIAKVVQNDQALSAKVLRTINSSYYGLAKPCATISRAMVFLGINTVKSLVLSFSLVDMTRRSDDGFDLVGYWRRCIHAAAAARRIAQITRRCDADEAFTAALLQDVGMLALQSSMRKGYGKLLEHLEGDHRKLVGVERSELGFTHAEVGARLGEKWKLPSAITVPIRHHHESDAPAGKEEGITKTVIGAYELAVSLTGPNGAVELTQVKSDGHRLYGLDPDETEGLFESVVEDGRSLSSLLKVRVGEPIDVTTIMAQAEDQRIVHNLNVQRQVAELQASNTQLAAQALTDGLTNVGNRKRFDRELARLFDQARESDGSLGVLMVDGDRFKSINDNHGHPAGDAVLVELASRIAAAAGKKAIVCRYGGEEFAVLLPGASLARAAKVGELIRQSIEAIPFDVEDVECEADELDVTVSLGGAALEPDTAPAYVKPELLVTAADKALYAAKESGRNRVRVFKPKITRAA